MKNTCQFLFLFAFFMLFVSGCNENKNESSNPKFVRAKKLNERERYAEAVEAFNEYLLINPRSVKTHMYLADLYYDHMDQPLNAIYHYRRVLILDPQSEDKEVIGKYLQNAEIKYYKSLESRYAAEGDIGMVKKELELTKEKVAKYHKAAKKYYSISKTLNKKLKVVELRLKKKEIELSKAKSLKVQNMARTQPIKTQIVKSLKTKTPSPKTVVETSSSKNHSVPTSYVIQPGDSLTLISKKVYGTTKYFKKIFQANLNVIPTTSQLKVGQRIVIPKL